MTDQQQQVALRTAHPLVMLKNELDRRSKSFKFALPSHISPEKFIRVVITAVQRIRPTCRRARINLFSTPAFARRRMVCCPTARRARSCLTPTARKRRRNGR